MNDDLQIKEDKASQVLLHRSASVSVSICGCVPACLCLCGGGTVSAYRGERNGKKCLFCLAASVVGGEGALGGGEDVGHRQQDQQHNQPTVSRPRRAPEQARRGAARNHSPHSFKGPIGCVAYHLWVQKRMIRINLTPSEGQVNINTRSSRPRTTRRRVSARV